MSRLVLPLPAHRIAAGNVVAVGGPGRRSHRFTLPHGVSPGHVIRLPDTDVEVEVVLVLRGPTERW